ncbi:Yip1 domain-containing protein [Dethiosulfatibacter aminovorans DSM 17477]|uniref:Yip1 domain-containing protein n=1 Tax=Dethiosulfatibacter aminovorans DSM 17477 TaxID=1121476 RepID=A0A1M6D1S3_9FIRM|nr:YIP1 family protein [Dethiosulfatibacter aminovorans]SHI67149.1 Yip1 domain-containing protein [Dethiosulfatibacter aminovorans DSM 17477]
MNTVKDFKNLIIQPVAFFDELASREEKNFILPLAAVFIMAIISSIIVKNLYMEHYAAILQSVGDVSKDELARELRMQGITSILVSSLAPMIVIFIKSYLVNGIASFGGFGKLKDSLTVISYAYLPAAAGALIASITAVLIGHYGFDFSPGSIMELGGSVGIASVLLKEFDIFVIWYEILAVIGISKIYRVNYGKAAVFILGTWFSWILISAGFALMAI